MNTFNELDRDEMLIASAVIRACSVAGVGGNLDTALVLRALAVFAESEETQQLDDLSDYQQNKAHAIIEACVNIGVYRTPQTAKILRTLANEIEFAQVMSGDVTEN